MNYISAEDFFKQPEEIQNVLLEWWQPSAGDLIYNKKFKTIGVLEEDYNNELKKKLLLDFSIPLLIETQLRKFIQDKGYKNIGINNFLGEEIGFMWNIKVFENMMQFKSDMEFNCDTPLECYWQVAIRVASEQ